MANRPSRYRNAIVPHIYVDGASEAIAFYKAAFGAEEVFRVNQSGGKILHAEISICGSVVMIRSSTPYAFLRIATYLLVRSSGIPNVPS